MSKESKKGFIARGLHWPAMLVAILASSVIMHVVIIVMASGDPSFVVEENYYEEATRWDQKQEERRASEALGWKLSMKALKHDREVEVELVVVDRDGRPIEGADVWVKGFAVARSGDVVQSKLASHGDGYRGRLDRGRAGIWQLDVEVRRGDERFVSTERVDVFAGGNEEAR